MPRRYEIEPNESIKTGILNAIGELVTVPKDTNGLLITLQATADAMNLHGVLAMTMLGHEPDIKKAVIGLVATRLLTNGLTYIPRFRRS